MRFLEGDAISVLQNRLSGDTWDYCLTSPPYFGQVAYSNIQGEVLAGQYGLERSLREYLCQQRQVFDLVYQGLRKGGVCWIVIGDTSNNYSPIRSKVQRRSRHWTFRRQPESTYQEKEALGVPFLLARMLRRRGWLHRKTLVWDKGQSGQPGQGDAPGECHEYVLMMAKWLGRGRPYLNTRPLQSSVLRHSPVKHPTHPCPFPPGLARELLESATVKGAVLDPYLGTGTTAQVAGELGMDCLGIDLDLSHLGGVQRCLSFS